MKAEKKIRNCEFCRKPYVPRVNGSPTFCTKVCAHAAKMAKIAKQKKKCIICGDEFGPKVEKQITCSKSCAAVNRRNTGTQRYAPRIETQGPEVRFRNKFLFWHFEMRQSA